MLAAVPDSEGKSLPITDLSRHETKHPHGGHPVESQSSSFAAAPEGAVEPSVADACHAASTTSADDGDGGRFAVMQLPPLAAVQDCESTSLPFTGLSGDDSKAPPGGHPVESRPTVYAMGPGSEVDLPVADADKFRAATTTPGDECNDGCLASSGSVLLFSWSPADACGDESQTLRDK